MLYRHLVSKVPGVQNQDPFFHRGAETTSIKKYLGTIWSIRMQLFKKKNSLYMFHLCSE